MALTDREAAELDDLLRVELRHRCAGGLATYAGEVLQVTPARHHVLLCDALEQIERREIDLLVVSMPPGSAKSSYGSIAFPAWYLGRHPEHRIIAASHTAELAERFGRRVRNIVAGEEHKLIFPECIMSPDSQAAGRWDTTIDGGYYAAGIGGAITGMRADIACIDDPVKSREDADSETIREKQWAWWRDDLLTRLKPNAGVILIGTRWHEDDLIGRVLADAKQSQSRVRVIKLPMEATENDELGRRPGELLWPEWFTAAMVEQAKREPRTWTALYQQEPRPIGGGEFRREWLCQYRRPPAASNRVLLVDPASGKYRNRGDYTSMWVVGIGPDGNEYILDGVRDRLNLTGRAEKVFDLVRRWKPAVVGYEEYGLQADIEHIKIEQERQQYRFRVIPLGGGTKKEDRIRRLIPGLQQGRVWLPESMVRQCADGHQRDIILDLIGEMESFPVGAHDDALDCLARKEEPEIRRFLTQPSQDAATSLMLSRSPPKFSTYDTTTGY